VYVSPAHRGRGFGRSVVAACVDHARTWPNIEWVALGVSAEGEAARSLYESLGFTTWGTEPDALRIDGAAIAQHHMTLRLSRSTLD
jgi:ribosomal protein S18 acetylase RimI-like enzyme